MNDSSGTRFRYPQPVVEVEDGEALQFVTDLIDPDGQSDGLHLARLHPDISGFGPGDLFEFVVAIACALTCPPSWNSTYLDRPSKLEDYVRFTPEVLASAGRTVLDWPNGFDKIAEEVKASAADRSGYYSVRKELAPLVALTRDPHLPEPMRLLVRSRIKRNTKGAVGIPATLRAEYRPPSDFIPLWEAAPRFAVGEKTILKLVKQGHVESVRATDAKKSPVLVHCQDLQAILELRRSTMEARSAAIQLGIPRQFLKGIVKKGYIVPVAKHDADPGAEFYSKESIEELKRRCLAMVRNERPPIGAVRISRAINDLRLGLRTPWSGIVTCILDGSMKIWSKQTRFTISSCFIRYSEDLLGIPEIKDEIEDNVLVSQGEAASILGTTITRVNQLARSGSLPVNPAVSDLKKFSETYVLTPEAIEILAQNGIKMQGREIVPILDTWGVEPFAAVNCTHGYVWRRDEICALTK